jgi:hypothetical protein
MTKCVASATIERNAKIQSSLTRREHQIYAFRALKDTAKFTKSLRDNQRDLGIEFG